MAISYVGAGTAVYSTSNPAPTAPSHNVGDLLILVIGTKPDTTPATQPANYEVLGSASGGVGSQGIDTGPMRVGLFYRIATASGTGAADNPGAVTITGNSVSSAQIFAFRADAGNVFDIAGVGAADTTAGTPHTVTMPTNPGITVGDMLYAVGVIPTDVTTPSQFSAQTVAATGMTTVAMTEITEWDTASGQDMGGWHAYGAVVTGTATGNPTVSATAGGTTTNVHGPIYLVRMRDLPAQATKTASDSGTFSATETATAVQITSKSASDSGTFSVTETASKVGFVPAPEPVLVSQTDTIETNTNSISVVTPVSLAVDDLVIAVAMHSDIISTWSSFTFSANVSGVTQISVPGAGIAIYYGKVTSAGTVTVTADGDSLEPVSLVVSAVRGADLDTPPNVHGQIAEEYDWSGYGGLTVWDNELELPHYRTTSGSLLTTNHGTLTQNGPDQQLGTYTFGYGEVTDRPTAGTAYDVWLSDYFIGYTSAFGIAVKPEPVVENSTPITGSDSGTLSATETANVVVVSDSKSASDSGSFSAAETTSIAASISRTDSGIISAVEVTNIVSSSTRTDSGTLSATESKDLVASSTRTDSGTFSVIETAAVAVVATSSDSGSLVATETANVVITSDQKSASDSGSFAVVETRQIASSSTRTDSGTLSATESVAVLVSISSTDSGSFSSTETAVVSVTQAASDSGTFSATESVAIQRAFSSADSGTFSAVEAAASSGTANRTDSGTFSATETAAITRAFASTDSGTFSVTETTDIQVFGVISKTSSDAGAFSSTESTSTQQMLGISGADSGAFSATEARSVASSTSTADSGFFAATEQTIILVSVVSSDSGTLSATESANVFNNRPGADSGTLSATETSSVAIFGLVLKSASDSGTLVGTDTALGRNVFVSVADSGTLSATESLTLVASSTRTDSGTLSATESVDVQSPKTASDSGTFSATETSSLLITEGVTVEAWNGTTMVAGILHIWLGAQMATPNVWAWNGSAMVAVS